MKFDKDWITFDNGVRLKVANIIGYVRNKSDNFTRIITLSDTFGVNETPDDIDVMLGKTVSTNGEKK